MLIAQDFVAHAYLIGLTPLMSGWLGSEILWKLRFVWIIFFLPEGLSEAFIGYETPFHSTFLFQIRKHISDAMCECYVMYDFPWIKCLCIRFIFTVFSFIKFATFSSMHTLRACWCSLFLLYLRRYFCLDTYPSRCILFFVLGNKTHSCLSLYVWKAGFFVFVFLDLATLVSSINFSRIMKIH